MYSCVTLVIYSTELTLSSFASILVRGPVKIRPPADDCSVGLVAATSGLSSLVGVSGEGSLDEAAASDIDGE